MEQERLRDPAEERLRDPAEERLCEPAEERLCDPAVEDIRGKKSKSTLGTVSLIKGVFKWRVQRVLLPPSPK